VGALDYTIVPKSGNRISEKTMSKQ
jgi:hypothetical protein